jgi:hypothetical protein
MSSPESSTVSVISICSTDRFDAIFNLIKYRLLKQKFKYPNFGYCLKMCLLFLAVSKRIHKQSRRRRSRRWKPLLTNFGTICNFAFFFFKKYERTCTCVIKKNFQAEQILGYSSYKGFGQITFRCFLENFC